MNKVAVVYWSGIGNTEKMAEFIVDGAKSVGAEVSMYRAAKFTPELIQEFDILAFGCSAMGVEELEDHEFLPMWESVKESLVGKKVALFGSCGWSDGEWMRKWSSEIDALDTVTCIKYPDSDAERACYELGKKLAE